MKIKPLFILSYGAIFTIGLLIWFAILLYGKKIDPHRFDQDISIVSKKLFETKKKLNEAQQCLKDENCFEDKSTQEEKIERYIDQKNQIEFMLKRIRRHQNMEEVLTEKELQDFLNSLED
jgi:hypothetical protein